MNATSVACDTLSVPVEREVDRDPFMQFVEEFIAASPGCIVDGFIDDDAAAA